MFERFTDGARRVVVMAQEEARLLNHHYIGTEHLLLGMIAIEDGVASKALVSMGISLETVREKVTEILGTGASPTQGHIPFTPRAKKVLDLAAREAVHLGHPAIGSEHLLLALIREGEGVAAQVLIKLGADLGTTRERVLALLGALGEPSEVFHPGAPGQAIAHEAAEPVCPYCHSPLLGLAKSAPFTVPGAGDRTRRVLALYCGRCGTTLGLLPDDDV